MKAYVFPGQGAQFVGMGKDLYENNPLAKEMFEKANEILGFRITDLMFAGTDEDLRQTKVHNLLYSFTRLFLQKHWETSSNQTWLQVIPLVNSLLW